MTADDSVRGRGFTVGVALLVGAGTTVTGVWSLGWPHSFAELVDFPQHEHFLHDIGAFQLGLGALLLLACVWHDAMATALAATLVANAVHTVNHAMDLDHGGKWWHIAVLAAITAAVAAALALRLRLLGGVTGGVTAATRPELAPFVRQKTVLLTTYRKDGRPGSTPVSIAVDGGTAYIRSFEKAVKTRRLRNNPAVRIAPSTGLGNRPGPGLGARLRRLEHGSAEERRARRMLRTKYPVLHGAVVPFTHRVARRKTGRTVHFAVVDVEAGAAADAGAGVQPDAR
ncbi:PPOX class F420-dependent oxidoreductase [Streptomyces armeniacus]|uniref:PPOX class F420-dependent oxidoreductase n=2 Tax=Streptomyces armeniacus TaxID=83291 RepID=A0A345XU54_9ACTN|nr:PPOX class F420-dependent oxidoreductase [Streptomyces armeniacus]